jgi:hypothetical protein
MEEKTLQIIALTAGIALAAIARIAVLATGSDSNRKASSAADRRLGSWMTLGSERRVRRE